jgi:hypothetical protein
MIVYKTIYCILVSPIHQYVSINVREVHSPEQLVVGHNQGQNQLVVLSVEQV